MILEHEQRDEARAEETCEESEVEIDMPSDKLSRAVTAPGLEPLFVVPVALPHVSHVAGVFCSQNAIWWEINFASRTQDNVHIV